MSNHWKIYSLRRGDYRFYHGIGGILDKIGDYLERNWWDICLPSRSAIFFHTGVPQELLKRALLDYLVDEPISFPLDRNNNNNNSRPMRMKRVEANIIYFLMRRRILLVNSRVQWDKKRLKIAEPDICTYTRLLEIWETKRMVFSPDDLPLAQASSITDAPSALSAMVAASLLA